MASWRKLENKEMEELDGPEETQFKFLKEGRLAEKHVKDCAIIINKLRRCAA